jgi:hypothetical protein
MRCEGPHLFVDFMALVDLDTPLYQNTWHCLVRGRVILRLDYTCLDLGDWRVAEWIVNTIDYCFFGGGGYIYLWSIILYEPIVSVALWVGSLGR